MVLLIKTIYCLVEECWGYSRHLCVERPLHPTHLCSLISYISLVIGSILIYYRHYPVGVLYDMYGKSALPWAITVHFQNYPVETILRCPDEDTIKSHFLNTLKEVLSPFGLKGAHEPR